jgi:type IV pilus assembly protein PilB
MHIPETKLKDILITNGIVNEEEFQAVKATSVRLGQGLIDVLIGRGDVTEAYLVEILEPVFGSSLVRLKEVNIPFELLTKIPEGLAKSKHVIAYEEDKENGVLKVAMADPLDLETIEYLRQKLNVWIEPHLATFADIRHGLKQYKKKIGEEFNEIIDQNVREFLPNYFWRKIIKCMGLFAVIQTQISAILIFWESQKI